MKQLLILTMAAFMVATISCAQKKDDKKIKTEMKDTKVSTNEVSYAFGVNVAESIGKLNIENFNIDEFVKGFKEMKSGKTKMTSQESTKIINEFLQNMQKEKAMVNEEAGKKFLEKNAKDKGVVTLASGLQYKIEKEGTGAYPTANSEVEVNYKGTLIDGREFDSSYARNETAKFPLNGVIAGWTEGLQKVKEGGKIKLFIPQNLAYGEREMPGSIIEPGSTLIFEIELIKILK